MKGSRLTSTVSFVFFLFWITSSNSTSAAPAPPTPGTTLSEIRPSQNQSPQRPYSEAISKVLEDAERVFKIIAILIAGAWAYFNFFRGRTYRPRLEPSISGALSFNERNGWLVASVKLKNVGLSHVTIRQRGSALQVFTAEARTGFVRAQEMGWKRIAVFDVFAKHGWIEPGELLQEERFIGLPQVGYVAVRLDLRIVSATLIRNKWWEKKQPPEWNATSIVMLPQHKNEK